MKLNEAYPSNFLTAEDLNGRDVTITIEAIDLEDIGQGRDKSSKLVLTMQGKKKKLVLNKTNARTIAKVLGTEETDEWLGQRIIIGPREVEFQGEMVWSIRVSLKPPTSAQAGAPTMPPPAPEPPAEDPDWN